MRFLKTNKKNYNNGDIHAAAYEQKQSLIIYLSVSFKEKHCEHKLKGSSKFLANTKRHKTSQ